jgi:hypothetical protein
MVFPIEVEGKNARANDSHCAETSIPHSASQARFRKSHYRTVVLSNKWLFLGVLGSVGFGFLWNKCISQSFLNDVFSPLFSASTFDRNLFVVIGGLSWPRFCRGVFCCRHIPWLGENVTKQSGIFSLS